MTRIVDEATTYVSIGQSEKFPLVKVRHWFGHKISWNKTRKYSVSPRLYMVSCMQNALGASRCTMISGTKKKSEEKGEADRSLDVKKEAGQRRNCWKLQFHLKYADDRKGTVVGKWLTLVFFFFEFTQRNAIKRWIRASLFSRVLNVI